MFLLRSLVFAAGVVSVLCGDSLLRRFIMDGQYGGPVGGPAGDPSHQGGHYIQSPPLQQQQKSDKCVSIGNPCSCPMKFIKDFSCLICETGCKLSPVTAVPLSTTGQVQTTNPSDTSTSAGTTQAPSSSSVAMTTRAISVPITTTIDYCDVAKQLCHANCPEGYLVDPADCTFCVCKKDVLSG